MATITYTGSDIGSDGTIRWFGQTFEPGGSVETDDHIFIEAAKANPFFDVDGEGTAQASRSQGRDDGGPDETFGAYAVKHRGRGKWAVVKGAETVADGLTKDEATKHAGDLASAERSVVC